MERMGGEREQMEKRENPSQRKMAHWVGYVPCAKCVAPVQVPAPQGQIKGLGNLEFKECVSLYELSQVRNAEIHIQVPNHQKLK